MHALVQTALRFLDTPYVAGTLDSGKTERLALRSDGFDCLTFVEYCLATVWAEKKGITLAEALTYIRYRKGKKNGYASRLHYAFDWILDNIQKGVLCSVENEIAERPLIKKIDFMSTHKSAYPHLNERAIKTILQVETRLSKTPMHFIPKEEISDRQDKLKSGDIVFLTSAIEGLDTNHVGIVYRTKDRLTFIHASSVAKKVIVSPESLADYCAKITKNTGIIPVRMVK